MDKLNEMILQMKRSRGNKQPEPEELPVKKPKHEPPMKIELKPRRLDDPEEEDSKQEHNKNIFQEIRLDIQEDLSSEIFQQAIELETSESQGKAWKKGKYEHPFKEESKSMTLLEKFQTIGKWVKETLDSWQEHTDELRLKSYNEYFDETYNLMVLLLNAIQFDLLAEESLTYIFMIVRFCQIKKYEKANSSQFSLSSNATWANSSANKNTIYLISSDNQRLYAQSIKRLISVHNILQSL